MKKIKQFFFANTSIRQTVLKNTFWVAISTTTIKIVRAGIIIYAARLLGAEEYGIFTYAMSIAGIFAIFADMGITSILTRELAKRPENKSNYLATAFAVKIAFLALTVVLIALVGPFVSKFDAVKPLLIIVAISAAFESLRGFLYAIPRAENRMQSEAGISIVSEIVCTAIVVVVFFMSPSAHSLSFSYAIGNAIALLITLGFFWRYLSGMFSYFQKTLVGPIIRSSWPFTVMSIFSVFMTNLDLLMIGFFNNAAAVGLYSAAQKPIGLLYVLPGFLSISLFPIISKFIGEKKQETVSLLLEKTSRVSLAIALPIVAGGIILAAPLINVTYGGEYIGAVLSFQILLGTILAMFPGAIYGDVILAEDKQKVFIKSSIVGALVNVVLNLVLIPLYGIPGSAAATLAAQIAMNGILFFEVRKTHGMHFGFLKKLGKVIVSIIGMSAVVVIMKLAALPLLLIVPVGAAVYVGILFILKEELISDIAQSFNAPKSS